MAERTGLQQVPVNVVGSSTFGQYAKMSTAKTYNMYISSVGEKNAQQDWLINFPGYKAQIQLLPSGEGRGIFRSIRGNFMLAVVNANVYRIDSSLSATLIGSLNTDAGDVYIDENLNDQICIVDGTDAYIYNHSLPPNLTVQSLSGGLIPNYVTFHNTFFLFGNGAQSSQGSAWYAYSYASATTISQTSQLALQTKPDYAIAIKRIPGQSANVLVFGTAVCEVHQQVGGIQNYRRLNNVSVDYGCLNVATIDASDEYICWLAVNEFNAPVIMVYSGQNAVSISTDGISNQLGQIQFPQESTACFIRVDSHLMYQLTFYNAADNVTFLYDFKTQKFFHLSDQYLNYHPATRYAYFNNTTYFVSINNCNLYEISDKYTFIDENVGQITPNPALIYALENIRITDNIVQNDSDKFIVDRLVLTIEQGQDLGYQALSNIEYMITEDAFNPPTENDQIMYTEWGVPMVLESSFVGPNFIAGYQPRVDLAISTDGGYTWSSYVAYYMNASGFRKNIMNWNRLGGCNTITFKFRFWGTSRFVVNNAIASIRK
jgi:hypothetical protein